MARYLQFTPPLHGLLQGFAIAPLVSRLGIRGASELGTLVPALCYPLWGSAWLVPGKLRRAAVYGTVQVLGVNTWMVMSKLGTEARMMNALPEGVGKGELSAAISSLQMAVNVSSAGNVDIFDLGISDDLSASVAVRWSCGRWRGGCSHFSCGRRRGCRRRCGCEARGITSLAAPCSACHGCASARPHPNPAPPRWRADSQ